MKEISNTFVTEIKLPESEPISREIRPWKLSDEARRAIEEIESNSRYALMRLPYVCLD